MRKKMIRRYGLQLIINRIDKTNINKQTNKTKQTKKNRKTNNNTKHLSSLLNTKQDEHIITVRNFNHNKNLGIHTIFPKYLKKLSWNICCHKFNTA